MTSTVKPLERISSGIGSLDDLIEGGFIKGDLILIAGDAGSGKSTLCVQFACNAALKGEKVLYASFEEDARTLKRNMLLRGFDLQRLEDEGSLKVVDLEAMAGEFSKMEIDYIVNLGKKIGASIIIIDSISAFLLAFKEKFEARTILHLLYKMIKSLGYTICATLSIPYGVSSLGLGIEEAIADSLILLQNRMKDIGLQTLILIYKMRGTNHDRKWHTIMMEKNGISIQPYIE